MFDSRVHETSSPIGSVWELTAPPYQAGHQAHSETREFDVLVVGGGLTGLSAALTMSRDAGLDVCVVEAGCVGGGASGRNGGFCNVSPIRTFAGLIKAFGVQAARKYVDAQFDGVRYVSSMIDALGSDAKLQTGGTYEVAHTRKAFAGLQRKAALLNAEFGVMADVLSESDFAKTGHDSPWQHGALWMPEGFTVNPLTLARCVAKAAEAKGTTIIEGCRVENIIKDGPIHLVTIGNQVLKARKVILATNGYTPDRLSRHMRARLMPVISAVVATRPLTRDELSRQSYNTLMGCSTTHGSHYYYHLLPDRRLLFGGPGDVTGRPEDAQAAYLNLQAQLGRWLPAFADVDIEYRWRGLVCTSQRFAPSAGATPDGTLLYGLGYQGNGVAAACWTGRQLAHVASEQLTVEQAFPDVMRGLPRKFPFAVLRPLYARAAYAAIGLKDREDRK